MNEYEEMVRRLIQSAPRPMRRRLQANLPTVRARYADLDLLIAPARNHTEFFLWQKGRPPEHKATQHLCDLFRDKRITMVDVGANAGIFSLPLARVAAPGSRFVLVEPNPEVLARLRANIALNGLTDVEVVEVAISDEPGRMTLHFSPNDNQGEARLGIAFDTDAGGIDVEVTTLPDLLTTLGIEEVDLLKVDVEGVEDRVILPAIRKMPKGAIRRIYFEDSHGEHWSESVTDALTNAGFKEGGRFRANALYVAGD
ncbi:FkbM family methyltransferase [Jannaschia aquimarina]|uniref:NoeI protein n=1 Tax=Jannaschia aquimarina TaxID=935700 RepID=A0A0D1CS47_9RHOB|nr:FkbM family methyltransferase [Jannaschia aquimarina]KIT17622.1 2-O-methyltransferase NoeI [Jannaschia aquimarina]SNS80604.1 methyltransferase, FkbM family [Jannaschia aquimarina]